MSPIFPRSVFDPMFRSTAACALFADDRRLQGMLDFESALAIAEAEIGLIPRPAAEAIAACCRSDHFDLPALAEESARDGNLAISMTRQLTQQVRAHDPEAAGFVHWGATSQDAIDTGTVLQMRAAFDLQESLLGRVCARLAELAEQYRDTPMAGRTWLQHAVPITFGLVCAGWLDALLRHRERLNELRPRVLVLQFGGAAGTLASLGSHGLEVASMLARRLKLGLPSLSWHGHGDRFAEVATQHGLLMGTLGKIARDLSLLMQTEIAEVSEAVGRGRGGSSTMPHKRNPVAAASILASAARVPGLVSSMLSAMLQEHQRGLGGWQAGWETLPDICMLTLGALENMATLMEGLLVDEAAMRRNLECTRGLLLAEAVSMAVAPIVGKQRAHQLVETASHRAIDEHMELRRSIEADSELMKYLSPERLQELFHPGAYMGTASKMIDQVLACYHQQGQAPNETKGA